MATHRSAEKRARQALRRRARNRATRSRVRTSVKALRGALQKGDAAEAERQLRATERDMRRGASKGALKKKWVSRSVSRLARSLDHLRRQS